MPAIRRKRTYRKQPYKKPKTSRVSSKTIARIAKNVVLKTAETKYHFVQTENQQLFHNTRALVNGNLLYTAQGDGDNERIGDEVIAKGISMKLWVSNKNDRPNVTYRLIIVRCPYDLIPGSYSVLKGESGNCIIDAVNTNIYTVVKQKFFKIPGQTSAFDNVNFVKREMSKAIQLWIPLKKQKIKYRSDSGVLPKNERYCLQAYLYAYDAFGTLVTDNIASYAMHHRFYFVDV